MLEGVEFVLVLALAVWFFKVEDVGLTRFGVGVYGTGLRVFGLNLAPNSPAC